MAFNTEALNIKFIRSDKRRIKELEKTLGRNSRVRNIRVLGPERRRLFCVLVKDRKRHLVGGVLGMKSRDWLVIDLLWVDRRYRKHGLGSDLLRRLEALAVKRGCRWAQVETGDNQAPKFYPKYGYRCISRMRFTSRQTGFFFTKRLRQDALRRSDIGKAVERCGVSLEAKETTKANFRRVMKTLGKRINAFVTRNIEPLNIRVIAVEAKDREGRRVGGLTGVVYWDWFQTDHFWVTETWRKKGLEERIFREAESEACRKGCRRSMTTGYDFELPFYQKTMGYHPCVTYKDFPKGHTRFCLLKRLREQKGRGIL